ncbi:MAG: hypothetical protein ACK4V6_18375 [Microthrixaceae bacterium]
MGISADRGDRSTADVSEADRHLAVELQEFVYGTLTVMVAIGGLVGSSEPPTAGRAIAVILGVAFATMLAHTFAALTGMHVANRRPVQRAEAIVELGHSWRIVLAALPSIVVLALSATGLYSTVTAMRISNGLAVLALIAIGLIASRRAGSSVFTSVVLVTLATLMGLVIVALELFVHHL